MKKRVTSVLLVVLLLMVQVPSVFAVVTASGKCGDNLTWTLENDDILTISGTGAMQDYDWSLPWHSDQFRTVIIGNGVTSIGNRAFSACENLKNVTIPNSVTSIGEYAFRYCRNLTDITIPNSVTSIGNYAFLDCANLTDIMIPNSVTSIGIAAFSACDNLKNITISNGVISIGDYAFSGCMYLTDLTIPNSVTSIGHRAFYACYELENITIPNSVTSIGNAAFFDLWALKNVYYGGSQQQWEAIDIGEGNDDLKRATIHYSGSDDTPAPEPVTPTPVEPTPQTNNDISKYSYPFGNSTQSFGYPIQYRIPLDSYKVMFGTTANNIIEALFLQFHGNDWGGNCYGMATTAAMLTRAGSGVIPSDFRSGATRPGELQVSDTNSKLGLTLTRFIEAMQISQYGVTFASMHKQNINNLSGLLSAMSAFESGGIGPLVICVHGASGGHALLAYHLDGQRLYVYDCNYPNDGNRYITISESGWSYPMFDNVTWSNKNGGYISYIPYETYLLDWYSRGHLSGDPKYLLKEMIIIDAADATITDSRGNEVATFRNGRMVSGIDEAFPIPQLDITVGETSAARPQIAVWLPYRDEYRVTTAENATVSAVSVDHGQSVVNVTGGQTVSVSLSSSPSINFDDVSPGQYFYDPVMWAVGLGITNGTTPTTFSPQNICSRNHILTFLWRANGSPAASARNPFTDIDTGKDFGKAALWAYEKGLVSGTQFNGGTPCSRADVVTYLWKLAGRPSAGGNRFADVPSGAEYASAVSWAVQQGITKGTSETTFNPSGTCTRGQIVTFLYRAYADK